MARKYLFLLFLLMALPLTATHAQDAPAGVFFLARTDADANSVIDADDPRTLYAYGYGEDEAVALSAPEEDVLQFSVHPTEALLAYTTGDPEAEVTVTVIDTADGEPVSTTEVTDLTGVSVRLLASGLWLVGNDADDLPVIRGLDPQTGDVLGEVVTRRPGTQVQFAADGAWALTYNAEAAALSLYALPDLESVMFELEGFVAGEPRWAPVGAQFLLGARDLDTPTDLSVQVIDPTVPETTRYDLIELPVETTPTLLWSRTGERIALLGTSTDVLTLADETLLEDLPGTAEATTAWAAEDALVAVSSINESDIRTVTIIDTATGITLDAEPLAAYEIYSASWAPTELKLAFVGQSLQTGQFGVYVLDVTEDEPTLTAPFEAADPEIQSASVRWSVDGEHLMLLVPGDDLVFTSLGLAWALFDIDLEAEAVSQVSPAESIVNVTQVVVR